MAGSGAPQTRRVAALLLLAAVSTGCAPASPSQHPTDWLRHSAVEGPFKGAQSELLPIEADDAVWGCATAPVTLIAFLDFECPFCRAVHPTLRALMQKYGPEKLRFVFKHYPLPSHERGIRAALVARAVQDIGGVSAFLVFEDNLYSDTAEDGGLSDAGLSNHAARVGVDSRRLREALAKPRTGEGLLRDISFAEHVGLQAVPSYLINGVPLQGAMPREYFERVIEGELDAARRARARGVLPEKIYGERVRANVQAALSRR